MKAYVILFLMLLLPFNLLAEQGDNLIVVGNDGRFGFIDLQGSEVISLKFRYARPFSNGLALVADRKGYGYINNRGNVIIPLVYRRGFPFHNGLACVKKSSGWGVIDLTGKTVIPFMYDAVSGSFNNGLLGVKKKSSWGFIDTGNRVAIPYRDYQLVTDFNKGAAAVKDQHGWGAVDVKGRVVVPLIHDHVICSEGMIKARKDGKYGFFNASGKRVTPYRYRWAGDFSQGRAFVGTGNLRSRDFGYIDQDGLFVIRFRYPDVYIAGPFHNGLARVRHLKKSAPNQGYIDTNGKTVIALRYWGLSEKTFMGHAAVYDPKSRKWGIMDSKGNLKVPCTYSWIIFP